MRKSGFEARVVPGRLLRRFWGKEDKSLDHSPDSEHPVVVVLDARILPEVVLGTTGIQEERPWGPAQSPILAEILHLLPP